MFAPLPLACFVEHGIPEDDNAPSAGVEEAARLRYTLVADEDHQCAVVIELLQSSARVLDMADSPEGPKVVDGRPLAVPSLERRVAIECARR